MLVVGSHLSHGIASAFQSLGADNPTWTPRLLVAGTPLPTLGSAYAIVFGLAAIASWASPYRRARLLVFVGRALAAVICAS